MRIRLSIYFSLCKSRISRLGSLLIGPFANELLFRVGGKYAHDSQSVRIGTSDVDEERVAKKDVKIFIPSTRVDTNFSLLVARFVSI